MTSSLFAGGSNNAHLCVARSNALENLLHSVCDFSNLQGSPNIMLEVTGDYQMRTLLGCATHRWWQSLRVEAIVLCTFRFATGCPPLLSNMIHCSFIA